MKKDKLFIGIHYQFMEPIVTLESKNENDSHPGHVYYYKASNYLEDKELAKLESTLYVAVNRTIKDSFSYSFIVKEFETRENAPLIIETVKKIKELLVTRYGETYELEISDDITYDFEKYI